MKCSASFAGLKVNQCSRLICLTVVLLTFSLFRGQKDANIVNQVEATLWPVSNHPARATSFERCFVYK